MKIITILLLNLIFSQMLLGESKQPTRDLKRIFDHKLHEAPFKQKSFDCVTCHPMGKVLSKVKEKNLEKFRTGSCHLCHNSIDALPEAPKRCETCHLSTPKDNRHMLSIWKKGHGMAANQNPKDCERCHQPETCSACHSGQGALKRDMHSRSFLYSHAISARMNSKECTTCHQASFCVGCHQKEENK